MIPVILSGGAGTRLWPLSRKGYPKQFLPLSDSGKTMLQETVLRLPDCADPIVVCNHAHRFVIAEQFQQIQQTPLDIILEPVGKNTAPAVAIAALRALENDPEAILLILAADHVIKQQAAFHTAIEKAQVLAEQDYLVTFGIPANQPETG
ncbi:MAG: sugar phosphate nucleotidyltransferase, partial [bacterium]